MTQRAILANRRPSWRHKFDHGGLSYFGTASYFGEPDRPDISRPAEIFIDCSKSTSDAGYQAEAAAIYASFALQHGCPLERLVAAAPKLEDGSAAEPVGKFLQMVMDGMVIA